MAKSNNVKKMVMQPCFRSQQEKPKKGKGSYKRKGKHTKL